MLRFTHCITRFPQPFTLEDLDELALHIWTPQRILVGIVAGGLLCAIVVGRKARKGD
jgi:hypothetical protein